MLRIDIHTVHPCVTLHCSGRLVLGLEAETLRCMATCRSERCLDLDLRCIRTIDAAGLGLLIELQSWANDSKKTLRVVNPSSCVRRLVGMTNLWSVLEIVPSEELDNIEERCRESVDAGRAMTA